MKILKQGATEIYDYTCEEIIEETCPVCKAVFEYTESDIEKEVIENRLYEQQLLAYNLRFYSPSPLPVQSYLHTYVACPCCEHKITIW